MVLLNGLNGLNGFVTKLYADDLKLYTSLISIDDSRNLQDV